MASMQSHLAVKDEPSSNFKHKQGLHALAVLLQKAKFSLFFRRKFTISSLLCSKSHAWSEHRQ